MPGHFPLGSSTLPNGGFLYPGSLSRERDAASAAKLLCCRPASSTGKSEGVRWRERGSMSITYDVGAVSRAISQ